jgi:hypothetical protein
MSENTNASPFQQLFVPDEPVKNDDQIIFKLPKAQKDLFRAMCEKHGTEMGTVLRKFVAAQVTTQPAEG